MKVVSKSGLGLAWYSNTTHLKPEEYTSSLIINDLYIEGIDYLQVFGMGTKKRKSKRFKMTDLNIATRLYKKSFLIEDVKQKVKVCVMNCSPASPVLPPGSVSIKFDNQLLYLKLFNMRYLTVFFDSIGFTLKYISRLDIYRDFQKFRNIIPSELIRNFMIERYLSLSRAKFNVIGVNNSEGLSFEYLRNGKKDSGRQFYLYNKSLELKEVGHKEYIIQTWLNAGFNQNLPVWRLELSLTRGKRNVLLNENTGELEMIELKRIFSRVFIDWVYNGGLKTSFTFVENQGKRKSRSKRVKLFSKNKKNIRLIWAGKNVDILRMRKIIVKSLIVDILNDPEEREHKSRSIDDQIITVKRYVDDHSMSQHLIKIIKSLSDQYKTNYYPDLKDFIYYYFYNYWR